MIYLGAIAKYINDSLKKGVLKDERFQRLKIAEIAAPVYINDGNETKTIACIVDDKGEADYVGADDGHHLIIYHKIDSISVSKNKKEANYGDNTGAEVNTAKLSMVVFGSRKKLKLCADELALYIQSSFPDRLEDKSGNFRIVKVYINEIVLDPMQVFKEEYGDIDYFLLPEQFLFKLKYSVESTFLKNCFTTCL